VKANGLILKEPDEYPPPVINPKVDVGKTAPIEM
jgi:hypothetical protein